MISRKRKRTNSSIEDEQDVVKEDELEIKVKVRVGNKTIENDINDSLHIPTVDKLNPTIISNMIREIPSLHARWNFLYNEAVFEYDIMKTKLEVWISRKAKTYRQELNKLEKGRVTEKMIDESIKLDPEFEQMNEDLAEAKKNMKHILALANGFGEKGDKVISIASMMKWEGEILSKSKNVGDDKNYKHIQKEKNIENNKDLEKNDGWPT